MKTKILMVLAAIALTSCSVLEQQPYERMYLTKLEIKREYGLNRKECRAVTRAAIKGDLEYIDHAGRGCWMFDAKYDYSKFKADASTEAQNETR